MAILVNLSAILDELYGLLEVDGGEFGGVVRLSILSVCSSVLAAEGSYLIWAVPAALEAFLRYIWSCVWSPVCDSHLLVPES